MKHHIYITNEKTADNKVITYDNNPMFGIGQTNEPIRRFKELINNSSKSSNSVNMLKHYKTNKKDTDIHKLLDKIGFHNVNSVNDFIDGTSTIKNKSEVFSGVAKINYKDIVNIGDKLSIELIEKIINSEDPDLFKNDLHLLPHQKHAYKWIEDRIASGEKNLLLNHKPRSGKSFIMYHLLINKKYKNVLLLTQYPILNHQWKEEFEMLIGHNYNIIITNTLDKDERIELDSEKPNFLMISLQDAKGDDDGDDDELNVSDDEILTMLKKDKFKNILSIEWDLLIFDEVHRGKETKKTDDLLNIIKYNLMIGLSATPTKNILRGTFTHENTHIYDLVSENEYRETQRYSRFYTLPRMRFHLLSIDNAVYTDSYGNKKYVKDGLEYFKKEEYFKFQKFFRTYKNENGKLELYYKNDIIEYFKWVFGTNQHRDNAIDNIIGREHIQNILIFVENSQALPLLKECMEFVLRRSDNYTVYYTNSKTNNTSKLKKLIKDVENTPGKSIIFANRQLTTGVTLRRCDVVMLMNDWKSMDEYMQAAYRCQSPREDGGRRKMFANVFDFNPSRSFNVFYNYIISNKRYNQNTLDKNMEDFYRCSIISDLNSDGIFNEIDFDTFRNNIISNILYNNDGFNNIIKNSIDLDFDYISNDLKNKFIDFGNFSEKLNTDNVKLDEDSIDSGKNKKTKVRNINSVCENNVNNDFNIIKNNIIHILNKTPLLSVLLNFTDNDVNKILNKINNNEGLKKIYIDSLLLKTNSDFNNIYNIITELYGSLSFTDILNEYLTVFNNKYDSILESYQKNNNISVFIDEVLKLIGSYVNISESEKKLLGEVFTPFSLIDSMLDTLPKEVWSNPEMKWLDPANGIGNFPIKIVERLMIGLKDFLPNENDRYMWIMKNMIYVCDINPKNMFIYNNLFNPENKKDLLNTYTGSFLNEDFNEWSKEIWGIEKFDIIVMNPPYQESIERNNRMRTLYNLFIEKSINISNIILSVHPSRWMAGGFGLDEFRKMMFNRNDIKIIKHFNNASIFFDNVDIKGGIQYLLIDNKYNGLVKYNDIECDLNKYDIFVESKYYSILEKIKHYDNLSNICKSQSYYGFPGNESLFKKEYFENSVKVYVSKNKGTEMYVDIINIKDKNKLNGYKVFTPAASGSNDNLGYFGNKIIGYANDVCSKSYITLIVNSELEAINLITYMNTKFCNFFLSLRKNTQNIKPDTCKWIPLVDLSKSWTDDELYQYFKLTPEEINLIEMN